MNTRGVWQREIIGVLQDAAIRYEAADYGHVIIGVCLPWTLHRVAKIVMEKHERLLEYCDAPCATAHSFGTLALGKTLQWNPSFKLNRVILTNGILRRDFDWDTLAQKQQVRQVLNEGCTKDIWPKIAPFIVWGGAGGSGAHGFTVGENVRNVIHAETGHSSLLTTLHCRVTWLPFLLRGKFPPLAVAPSAR